MNFKQELNDLVLKYENIQNDILKKENDYIINNIEIFKRILIQEAEKGNRFITLKTFIDSYCKKSNFQFNKLTYKGVMQKVSDILELDYKDGEISYR